MYARIKIKKSTESLDCIQLQLRNIYFLRRDGRDRDRMVVGFTTTCAISAYHH